MAAKNRRAVRWLKGELPALVEAGAIDAANAEAIERHYDAVDSGDSRGTAFTLFAIVGSTLVGAGAILLVAHNWDQLGRGARSVIAFLPLLAAQMMSLYVLLRRMASRPWRESAAVFNVAAVGMAIALISQTYQIQGHFGSFMFVWMLLSIPVVYLMRTTFGAVLYVVGVTVWLMAETGFFGLGSSGSILWFWALLALIVPFFVFRMRRAPQGGSALTLAMFLLVATIAGLGVTSDAVRSNLGALAFSGLFAALYLASSQFFPTQDSGRPYFLTKIGILGIGAMAVILSFETLWRFRHVYPARTVNAEHILSVGVQLSFVVTALALAVYAFLKRDKARFNYVAALLPIVTGIGWILVTALRGELNYDLTRDTGPAPFFAALLFNGYALVLGVFTLMRGLRAGRLTEANLGLLIIAALAVSRFFDSGLGFTARGIGFMLIGAGFLVANMMMFKRKARA